MARIPRFKPTVVRCRVARPLHWRWRKQKESDSEPGSPFKQILKQKKAEAPALKEAAEAEKKRKASEKESPKKSGKGKDSSPAKNKSAGKEEEQKSKSSNEEEYEKLDSDLKDSVAVSPSRKNKNESNAENKNKNNVAYDKNHDKTKHLNLPVHKSPKKSPRRRSPRSPASEAADELDKGGSIFDVSAKGAKIFGSPEASPKTRTRESAALAEPTDEDKGNNLGSCPSSDKSNPYASGRVKAGTNPYTNIGAKLNNPYAASGNPYAATGNPYLTSAGTSTAANNMGCAGSKSAEGEKKQDGIIPAAGDASAKPVSNADVCNAPSGDTASKTGQKKQYSWDKKKPINKQDYMVMSKKNETITREGLQLQQFLIDGCENCDIFVLDPLATISVDYCDSCRIFVAPIESSIFIRNCTNCTFVICAQQFRSRECTDCKMALFSQTDPIVEMSSGMEFSCFPLCYFALKQHLDTCKISPWSNKWSKIFDFNKRDDGVLNYSLEKPYDTPEKLKRLIDFSKCSNTGFANEVEQFLTNSSMMPVIPMTLGPIGGNYEKTPENRAFILFFKDAKLDLFMQKIHEVKAGKYEICQSRVLGLNAQRADQLQIADENKKDLDFSKGEYQCTGLELCGEGINDAVAEAAADLERDAAFAVPKDRVAGVCELFFVTLKDDEGMAHVIAGR